VRSDGQDGDAAGRIAISRVASIGALVAALVLVAWLLFRGDSDHTYRLLFASGGQLVPGNEVLIAGQPVGSVEDVRLTDDWQAEVEISTAEPLRAGTEAVIRATSLSGIANRYVSVTPGPEDAEELEDRAVLTGERTTTPVDLDQLFNTFDAQARRGLQKVTQGFATSYTGAAADANATFRYLNPALANTQRLLAELNHDSQAFSDFLVEGSKVVTAVAQRRDDLSSLVVNANSSLGAIAQEDEAFGRALVALAPTLRQANTTFVNLRSALDDLDPLVAATKPATRDLAPFLRELRPVTAKAVPVFRDLRVVLRRAGRANDLTELLADLPGLRKQGSTAFPAAIDALDASQETVRFARPYTPDLLGWISKFGQVTSFYDANGHYAKVQPANSDLFRYDEAADPAPDTGILEPIPPSQQFQDLDFEISTRCPGGATQPNPGWPSPQDHPFLDDGNLAGACDPGDVPPGALP
jgi:phospholipid/cholesterol/gamma-HCH transport system substrate-binding protein